MQHLVDIADLTISQLDEILSLARKITQNPETYQDDCSRKKLATLFFEPSTRTRLSFEAAMLELGGNVIGFSEAGSSSTAKGESIADTIRTVSEYADIIAMRHPKEGAPIIAASNASVPTINAGDGGHNHPTQTLADLLTILREMGRLEGLKIGLCGDLQFGRTVHSLITAMARYKDIEFILISPDELKIPNYIKEDVLIKNDIKWFETENIREVISELDILYMTRVQKERFFNEADYIRLKDSYILTEEKMKMAKKDMRVLHPLPRVNEIETAVDKDPRAAYFRQVANGKHIRKALILKLLNLR